MSKENKDTNAPPLPNHERAGPPLPPRIPLLAFPIQQKRRNSSRKSALDVVPPPPFLNKKSNQNITSQIAEVKEDTHDLINMPNHERAGPTNSLTKSISQSGNLSNALHTVNQTINSINNNYYGINCNYFTVPSVQNSSRNSLSNSPVHSLTTHLSHSNSFPNFNHIPVQQHSATVCSITNPTPPTNTTNHQLTLNSNQTFNPLNQSTTNQFDNFKYQQFVLSKLSDLTKTTSSNLKKLSNDNLIDLGQKDDILNESSLLNLFDPLAINHQIETESNSIREQQVVYSTIKDSINNDLNDSIKSSIQIQDAQVLTEENFYESINYEKPTNSTHKAPAMTKEIKITFNNNLDYLKHRNLVGNKEISNFKSKLVKLRSKFKANDQSSNCGFVISSRLNSPKDTCLSVKLIIDSEYAQPISFTCNISTSVEHVVCHTVCSIFDSSTVNFSDYILKVNGLNEYFINDSSLGDYVYVNECHKFDKDVKLTLINRSTTQIDFYARTEADDEQVENLNEYDLLPHLLLCKYSEINYENVKIYLNIIDIEAEKLLYNNTRTTAIEYFDTGKHFRTNQENAQSLLIAVNQAVKALCSSLGFETTQLIEAQNNLRKLYLTCEEYKQKSQENNKLIDTIDIVYPEVIGNAILTMKKSIYVMLHLYSKVFPVNFYCELPDYERKRDEQRSHATIDSCQDTLVCKIDNLNELHCDWSTKYQFFCLKCELIHGEKVLTSVMSKAVEIRNVGKSPRIDFEELIDFKDQLICNLPRETYLYLTLIGISSISSNMNDTIVDNHVNEIGITSIRLFDPQNNFINEGMHLLGIWPEKYCTSVYKPVIRESFLECNCPLLVIRIINLDCIFKFPDQNYSSTSDSDNCRSSLSMSMFNETDHANIYHILNQDPLDQLSYEDKQILWEKRYNLTDVPSALPKILSSVPSWQSACLPSIYKLIRSFKNLAAIDAMQLLLPSYADIYVREMAIKYIRKLDDDEIYDYLPQLVHAIRYETNLDSPLIWLLFEKSYSNLRIAHHFYWLLKNSLNDQLISWRMQVLLNAFLTTSSSSLKRTLKNEEELLNRLNSVNDQLKKDKDDRLKNLRENLESIHNFLIENETSLPLSLSMQITGLDLQSCNYFNSNTLPIKIAFKTDPRKQMNHSSSLTVAKYTPSIGTSSPVSPSSLRLSTIDALYKVGDDLRQDNITMQMISIMDKLLKKEGLDLKLITFRCIATDERKGFVEMIKNSETLRRIQGEKGVTGTFNSNSIAAWLQKYNTSELEYDLAVNNFTSSCAGYAVATYVLGIGDRHNDNIMLTTAGHLFHIDFGKFLGDAQMIGSIKRDRVPFVLTSDMAYVINHGDKKTIKFQNFIDLCCQAYNIIRQNSNLFLSLFSLMLSAGIPGLTPEAIKYVHNALKPTLTNCKASEEFNNLIIEALSSKSAQINFFIHNLAQMRFSSDYNDQKTLSFAPKIHTMETEGTILHIKLEGCRKLEDQKNKLYYYVFLVSRANQKDGQRLLRTYKEVYELYQKLSTFFRLAKFYSLPRPKSNSREFTEKKQREVQIFFEDLLQTANEILHSDLVYTFFHPLLRDQEISHSQNSPLFRGTLQAGYSNNIINRANHSGNGEIKLSLLYKNGVLMIMIMHARNLYSTRATDPDTYVKTYLLPDPYKESKRKTKVIYKSKHPTFLEMITYDIGLKKLVEKQLEVSVWYYLIGDREKKLLGATLIQLCELDLRKEIIQWYPLTTKN